MSLFVIGVVFGWMVFWGVRVRRVVDKGFVLFDYCDWYVLFDSIKVIGCEKVICIYGYIDIFLRYLWEIGYDV